jgi:hypothetical protein
VTQDLSIIPAGPADDRTGEAFGEAGEASRRGRSRRRLSGDEADGTGSSNVEEGEMRKQSQGIIA